MELSQKNAIEDWWRRSKQKSRIIAKLSDWSEKEPMQRELLLCDSRCEERINTHSERNIKCNQNHLR